MNLLPWHRFEIESPADINAVLGQLRDETEAASFVPAAVTKRSLRMSFRGSISDASFRISVRSLIVFSPMPEMHGTLTASENGTIIRVEMVPATWLLTIVAGVFVLLSVIIFDTGSQVFAMAAALIPFGWFLTTAGFLLDGGDSRKKLEAVLAAASGIQPGESAKCAADS
jgi:hypothetical protein